MVNSAPWLLEKIDPNRTTKMTGKASVQKSEARSR
jgi:hypothetical protein